MSDLGKCGSCEVDATVLYPLLPGEPRYCTKHDPNPGHFHDFPENFEAFEDLWPTPYVFSPPYDKRRKTWKERSGMVRKLGKLDDSHIMNIPRWIRRNAALAGPGRTKGVDTALAAIGAEIERRGLKPYE